MKCLIALSLVLACTMLVVGCSGDGGSTKISEPGKVALEDLGNALKSLADDKGKAPTAMGELGTIDPMAPVGAPAVRNGEIVYLWGASYVEGSTKVIAYEKNADTSGGYVLLQNGSVKKMTAAEFAAAEKAKKK